MFTSLALTTVQLAITGHRLQKYTLQSSEVLTRPKGRAQRHKDAHSLISVLNMTSPSIATPVFSL